MSDFISCIRIDSIEEEQGYKKAGEMVTRDNEILELLQRKEDKGMELLMDTYAGLVYTIVHNKVYTSCSREDIEECVSDVFYELYRNAEKVDLQKGSLKAFLAVIARRKAIDSYRKHHKQNQKNIPLDLFQELEDPYLDNNHEMLYDKQEIKNRIIEGIKSLGEPDSEILIRKYFFEQPSKVIGEVMHIKVNTIDKRISRALIKLKKLFEGEMKDGEAINSFI